MDMGAGSQPSGFYVAEAGDGLCTLLQCMREHAGAIGSDRLCHVLQLLTHGDRMRALENTRWCYLDALDLAPQAEALAATWERRQVRRPHCTVLLVQITHAAPNLFYKD